MIDGDANILGALALAVTDGVCDAVVAAGGGSRSKATALSRCTTSWRPPPSTASARSWD
jgi:hypothetical protein